MMTTICTLWIETRTGQRIQLASSSCRTFALLVGEAVWTHVCQTWQRSTLEVRLLEVLAGASPCESDASHVIARWLPAGQEKRHTSNSASQTPEREPQSVSTLVTPASELQATEPAAGRGLAAFFPTAEEWASWRVQER